MPESNIGKFVVPAEMPVMNDGGFTPSMRMMRQLRKEKYRGPLYSMTATEIVITNLEVVEEALSLEEMEKDMIKKALKKFAGKRKDAADELGISERTLYRKIKQYDIPD